MTEAGPYTTITVAEYVKIQSIMNGLRKKIQASRQLLEAGASDKALTLLREEND